MLYVLLLLYVLSWLPLVWFIWYCSRTPADLERARAMRREQELHTIPGALAEDLKQAAKARQTNPETFVAQAVESAVRATLDDTHECTGYNDEPSLELTQAASAPGASSIPKPRA